MALYDAFISYSHAEDKPLASALQGIMQKLGKPWYHRRALRIFRDDTSLAATPGLWPSIESALAQSRYLIVLASPQFAASRWCAMEVAYWLDNKGPDSLLIALAAGELVWDAQAGDFAWSEAAPLPPSLRGRFRSEPKWIDLRPYRAQPDVRATGFADAGADLAAAVHGVPKEDLLSQEVRQQRRSLALAWSAAAALSMLALAAGWQWWEADVARRVALAAERKASAQQAIAEQQRDRAARNFLQAKNAVDEIVFGIAQSLSTAPGMRIETTRRILELAQSQFDELLKAAPEDRTLQRSRAAILAEFASVYLRGGDLGRARAAAEASVATARRLVETAPNDPFQRRFAEGDLSVSLEKFGVVLREAGDIEGAVTALGESLALRRRHAQEVPGNGFLERLLSVSLGLVGDLLWTRGDLPSARAMFEERLAIVRRLAAIEPDDAEVQIAFGDALESMGRLSAAQGNRQTALAMLEEGLAVRRRALVSDPQNTSRQYAISSGLLVLGEYYLEAEQRAAARPLLQEGLAIARLLAASDPAHLRWQYHLSVMLERVGSLYLAEGDKPGALTLFDECLNVRRRLSELHPDNAEIELSLAVALYKVGANAPPPRARKILQEAVALIDRMSARGRLKAPQRGWPHLFREALSAVPAADGG